MVAKINAYGVFVNDIFNRRRKMGEPVNRPSLFQELGPQWNSMSDEEKQPYKDRAKAGPNNKPLSNTFDGSISSSFTQASARQELKPNIDQKEDLKRAICLKRAHEGDLEEDKSVVKKLKPGIPNWHKIKHLNMDHSAKYYDLDLYNLHKKCEAIIDSRKGTLTTTPIYTFSVNVMCKEVTKDKEEIFIPIELSIYSYSIEKGMLGSYHVFIDAGSIPTGFFNATKDHAVNHKITIPSIDAAGYPPGARSDYKKIYREILDFTKDGERVILIAEPRDLAQVKGSLDWLHKKAQAQGIRYPGVSSWTVLPIADFVATTYNTIYLDIISTAKSPLFALRYRIKNLLADSSWDYNDTLMCDYHKKEEHTTKWCARSCAIRLITHVEKELNDVWELQKRANKVKQDLQPPSLPSSQPVGSQNNQLPETKYADDRLELGSSEEPILAIEAPPSEAEFDLNSYAM